MSTNHLIKFFIKKLLIKLKGLRSQAKLTARFENQKVYVSDTAIIDTFSTIAEHSKIEALAIIKTSTLASHSIIGRNTLLESSSTGTHTYILNNCQVSESELAKNVLVNNDCILKGMKIAAFVNIHDKCWITTSSIGSYSYIGAGSSIHNTEIGRFCSIAQGLSTGSGNHPTFMISTSPVFYSPSPECNTSFSTTQAYDGRANSKIGHDVWVGSNVFIKSGVQVGNGAIIAAGSVVVRDVEPYAIVGGVPARLIRKRFEQEAINMLEIIQWWNWPADELIEAIELMRSGNIFALAAWHEKRKNTSK